MRWDLTWEFHGDGPMEAMEGATLNSEASGESLLPIGPIGVGW